MKKISSNYFKSPSCEMDQKLNLSTLDNSLRIHVMNYKSWNHKSLIHVPIDYDFPFDQEEICTFYQNELINHQFVPSLQSLVIQPKRELPPIGYDSFDLKKCPSTSTTPPISNNDRNENFTINNQHLTLYFENYKWTHYQFTSSPKIKISQEYIYYKTMSEQYEQNSGAYIFNPMESSPISNQYPSNISFTKVTRGELCSVVTQIINNGSIHQSFILCNDSPHVKFKIKMNQIEFKSIELLMRITSPEIQNESKMTCDLNGLESHTIFRNSTRMNLASNFLPMVQFCHIRDSNKKRSLSILTSQPMSVANLIDGSMELIIYRNCGFDDGRGLGEIYQDNVPYEFDLEIQLDVMKEPSKKDLIEFNSELSTMSYSSSGDENENGRVSFLDANQEWIGNVHLESLDTIRSRSSLDRRGRESRCTVLRLRRVDEGDDHDRNVNDHDEGNVNLKNLIKDLVPVHETELSTRRRIGDFYGNSTVVTLKSNYIHTFIMTRSKLFDAYKQVLEKMESSSSSVIATTVAPTTTTTVAPTTTVVPTTTTVAPQKEEQIVVTAPPSLLFIQLFSVLVLVGTVIVMACICCVNCIFLVDSREAVGRFLLSKSSSNSSRHSSQYTLGDDDEEQENFI
ncbi:1 TM domain-containing transmembrane protein [Acrasis kona]|uniref:1 TM domain-containing transmembrane protein n=1 Tax=Acrasis kona TaxID=1008807 RepID=A0AAW2ZDL6_9EUKA